MKLARAEILWFSAVSDFQSSSSVFVFFPGETDLSFCDKEMKGQKGCFVSVIDCVKISAS